MINESFYVVYSPETEWSCNDYHASLLRWNLPFPCNLLYPDSWPCAPALHCQVGPDSPERPCGMVPIFSWLRCHSSYISTRLGSPLGTRYTFSTLSMLTFTSIMLEVARFASRAKITVTSSKCGSDSGLNMWPYGNTGLHASITPVVVRIAFEVSSAVASVFTSMRNLESSLTQSRSGFLHPTFGSNSTLHPFFASLPAISSSGIELAKQS